MKFSIGDLRERLKYLSRRESETKKSYLSSSAKMGTKDYDALMFRSLMELWMDYRRRASDLERAIKILEVEMKNGV